MRCIVCLAAVIVIAGPAPALATRSANPSPVHTHNAKSQENTAMIHQAKGTFDVRLVPLAQDPEGTPVGRMSNDKRFHGDLDGTSRASRVILGLYTDSGGEPGTLLGSGALAAPAAGAWNTVNLATGVPIVNGTAYWIGLLNPSDSTGVLSWRDHAGGSGGAERTSQSSTLSALPATWATGNNYSDGPLSASAWGPAGPLPPKPAALEVTPASLSLAAATGATALAFLHV